MKRLKKKDDKAEKKEIDKLEYRWKLNKENHGL